MNHIQFSPKGSASSEVQSVLDYLHEQHAEGLTLISAAVHATDATVEIGGCFGNSTTYTRGESESVNIPVCGTANHPSVYVHTQPMMKWRPSLQDIQQTVQRGETTRGFLTLTTNGIDSVFGSVTALPEDVTEQLHDDVTMQDYKLLERQNHIVKISSVDSAPTNDEVLEAAANQGLISQNEMMDEK